MKIKVDFENLTEQEKDQLMTLVGKANKPKVKLHPDFGEAFYKIDAFGTIFKCRYLHVNQMDSSIWQQGNGFFTEEEAEFERECRKVAQEAKEFVATHGGEFTKEEWGDTYVLKVYFYYNHRGNSTPQSSADVIHQSQGKTYFRSHDDARAFRTQLGEERFMKYFMKVEV